MSLEEHLVLCWYARRGWCRILYPLSLLFEWVVVIRRGLYRWGVLTVSRLPVPVIVVGNLVVGGTGKTPLVIWLVERLRASGYRPGVVSRGYGSQHDAGCEVRPNSDPRLVGDEPLLVACRSLCPVWVGRDRAGAARRLIETYPEVDVVIADDGLQHYALGRDMEIVVVDGQRRFGNGFCLPAGPLREGLARLTRVDAVVVNGGSANESMGKPTYSMRLRGHDFSRLGDPGRREAATSFQGRAIHAVAGIGNPSRFFDALEQLDMTIVPHVFPDHHDFKPSDLPKGTVVMTEKDAVKCAAFGHDDAWVFQVDAEVSEGLDTQVLEKLESKHGQ